MEEEKRAGKERHTERRRHLRTAYVWIGKLGSGRSWPFKAGRGPRGSDATYVEWIGLAFSSFWLRGLGSQFFVLRSGLQSRSSSVALARRSPKEP